MPTKDAPIVVVGVFRSASGLGTAARATYGALCSAGLKPIAVDVTSHFTPVDFQPDMPLEAFDATAEGTIIFHLNAPEVRGILRILNYLDGKRWRVIGYWAWELPVFPKAWDEAFDHINEIWTLSEFTAEVFSAHPGAPLVRPFPIPIEVPDEIRGRSASLDGGPFTVLVMADARSSFGRKNVFGSIKAFRNAFGLRQDVQLVLKTRNVRSDPYIRRVLTKKIGSASNIKLIDECLTSDQYWALLARADVFLSLHRAEGFGLPIAEAMALGKLVVATGWSGNCSFMTRENSLWVDYQMTPVEDDFALYNGYGGDWAEPDAEHASQLLRAAHDDPAQFEHLRVEAKRAIRSRLNPADVGASMRRAIWQE